MIAKLLCSDIRRDAMLKMLEGPIRAADVKPDTTTSNKIQALRPAIKAGYIEKVGYDYSLTGPGRIIALQIRQIIDSMEVLQCDFFRQHDLSSIPDRLLMRIGALKGGGVVMPNGDAMKAQKSFMEQVAEAKRIIGTSCFNVDGYQEMISSSLANGADVELILTQEVIMTLDRGIFQSWQASGRFTAHVREVKAAFTVADNTLFLALFDYAGIIDALSEWVCESEQAAEWGRELFEYYLRG